MKARWLSVAAVLLALILLPFAFFEKPITAWSEATMGGRPTGALAVLAAGLLAADVVLPVPSSLVSTACGSLFGFGPGLLVSWTGMMVGSAGAWWLGRSVGRAGLLRFMGPGELARAEGVTARFGGAALVLSRPVPVLAEATSLLAGACGMPFRRAMLLSALSNAGISAAYAAVGAYSQHADSFLLAFAGAIGLPGIAMLVARIGWRRSLAEGSPPT